MQNPKDNIRQKLIATGRQLVREKGTDFLTARKLSEASGCSIGTIYNQFGSMDEYAVEQNEITLDELYDELNRRTYGDDSYANLNVMIDVFASFVENNRELWFLLYNFHLNRGGYVLKFRYKSKLFKTINFMSGDFIKLFPDLVGKRRRIMRDVMLLGLFGISAMLTTDMLSEMKQVNRDNICQIYANTFWAGLTLLKRD